MSVIKLKEMNMRKQRGVGADKTTHINMKNTQTYYTETLLNESIGGV